MAESEVNSARPNIRIEIHNNLMQSMDVDEEDVAAKLSDGEEGEIIEESIGFDDIIDDNITYPTRPTSEHHKKPKGSQIGIFDKEEQKRRTERAKRFQLDPNEPLNFTSDNLLSLHESLGINATNEDEICFDTLHLHGIEKMSSHDIMDYFANHAPVAVEWVNNNSCNVLWPDDLSSAKALFNTSRAVKGMPVDGLHVPEEKGKSILLKNNNREVVLDDKMDDEVSVDDIKIPIPAGYWRLGLAHVKSKCILLRFALFSDRKFKHGPELGGGLISESKKAQFRGIFERNREISTKNPWGDLARSWNRDKKTEDIAEPPTQPAPQLKHRLGFKRKPDVVEEESEDRPVEKPKIPRMRMYADEEEAKIKRKKALDAIKRVANPVNPKIEQVTQATNDLRSVIRKKDVWDSVAEREVSGSDEGEIDDDLDLDLGVVDTELPIRSEVDLGNRLMNRRLKFTNPPPLTIYKQSTDVRQRLDNKMTKQHRFREELLKNKRLKSPPPPPRENHGRHSNRAYNSRYSSKHHDRREQHSDEVYSDDDDDDDMRTNSKVTVVIKKPKQPTVASTVWSRVNTATAAPAGRGHPQSVKERLQMPLPVTASRSRKTRESSASSDDGSASSSQVSSNSSNEEEAEEEEEDEDEDESMNGEDKIKPAILSRPGFRGGLISDKMEDHKSPLRIEINNDHYKK